MKENDQYLNGSETAPTPSFGAAQRSAGMRRGPGRRATRFVLV